MLHSFSLSVGFDGSLESLKQILESSERISSVYTGGLKNFIKGGRSQFIDHIHLLPPLVKYAKSRNVDVTIALNASCGIPEYSNRQWWRNIREYIQELENCGVHSVIVSHPFLMNTIKSNTQLSIVVSTICEINNPQSALYYENMGADVIVPSFNLNMRIQILQIIQSALKHAKLRIMVNEHCLTNCPWRMFHFNHIAHSNDFSDYHFHCKKQFLKEPYKLLTGNVIRPEDLYRYLPITNELKIVGRNIPLNELINRIQAYDSQSYKGNFLDLSDDRSMRNYFYIPNEELNGLWEKKNQCDQICYRCGYCQEKFDQIADTDINLHFKKS